MKCVFNEMAKAYTFYRDVFGDEGYVVHELQTCRCATPKDIVFKPFWTEMCIVFDILV